MHVQAQITLSPWLQALKFNADMKAKADSLRKKLAKYKYPNGKRANKLKAEIEWYDSIQVKL